MRQFEVYTYTCTQHDLGLFVRKVEAAERIELESVAVVRRHFTNCWVKGCQDPLTQVRLVKDGDAGRLQEERDMLVRAVRAIAAARSDHSEMARMALDVLAKSSYGGVDDQAM
jgi:hypothetical protein